ncbi:hypothetical protein NC653_006791 [Populus alba x Populus x berolinensis]|uniref:Uncharacterized protein n=1 Tax=Populus alba x Populus x berolinensis TaxID=444605 RepID=A0AAD6RFE3_9ROSI|nr:hypothetical protein NC653_006791 [Populus alba x Populus x berolinensis]
MMKQFRCFLLTTSFTTKKGETETQKPSTLPLSSFTVLFSCLFPFLSFYVLQEQDALLHSSAIPASGQYRNQRLCLLVSKK